MRTTKWAATLAAAILFIWAVPTLGQEHRTHAVLSDITDPAHPIELWEGDNVISACGMRNLLALGLGATTMGSGSGGATTIGQLCAGTNANSSCTLTPCPYDATARVWIGSAPANASGSGANIGPYPCTANATPFPCCTGNGTGCKPSTLDVTLFGQGMPDVSAVTNGTIPNAQANYVAFVNNTGWHACTGSGTPFACCSGSGTLTGHGCAEFTADFLTVSQAPSFYWNGTTLEGIQFTAVAGASDANLHWCEYALNAVALTDNVTQQCGPFATSASCTFASKSGWNLNHAAITGAPCTSGKSSGQIWQMVVTVTWS